MNVDITEKFHMVISIKVEKKSYENIAFEF